MELKAKFDRIGKFINMDGEEADAKKAHYTFSDKSGMVGGFYVPVGLRLPPEITIILPQEDTDGTD